MSFDVLEARNRVRTYLQDNEYVRWSKHELNQYLHQAAEDFVQRVGYPIISVSFQSDIVSTFRIADMPTFTVGETITGSVTGTTAVIVASNTNDGTYDTQTGPGFMVGESVTGSIVPEGAGSAPTGVLSAVESCYEIDLPETLLKVTSVEVDGKEISLTTDSEMRYLAVKGGLRVVEDSLSKVTRIFESTRSVVPKWRETTGNCQALVLTSTTNEKIRIYPIPTTSQQFTLYGVYRPLHASDLIPYQYMNGTILTGISLVDSSKYNSTAGAANSMSDDNGVGYTLSESGVNYVLTPDDSTANSTVTLRNNADFRRTYYIDRQYMDVMVYGSLERAYLKEHDLRNVEKSEYYRTKKEVLTQQAIRGDALNSASISGGINYNRLKSSRIWQSLYS